MAVKEGRKETSPFQLPAPPLVGGAIFFTLERSRLVGWNELRRNGVIDNMSRSP